MKNIFSFLSGYKTYIMAALGIVTVLLYHYGKINVQTEGQLLLIFGFGSVAAIRSALQTFLDQLIPVSAYVKSQAARASANGPKTKKKST